MFEVFFGNNRAKKDYEKLTDSERNRINELCDALSRVPVPFKEYDLKKMSGTENTYRI